MIADVALALAAAWWVFVAWMIVAAKRALRDPQLGAKIVARMLPRPKTPGRSTLDNVEVRIHG